MFIPKTIIFEKDTLDYEIGNNIYNYFKDKENIKIIQLKNNRIKENIPGDNLLTFIGKGKNLSCWY